MLPSLEGIRRTTSDAKKLPGDYESRRKAEICSKIITTAFKGKQSLVLRGAIPDTLRMELHREGYVIGDFPETPDGYMTRISW